MTVEKLTAERTSEVLEGFDAFQEDMAEHQRSAGKQPTPDANRELAAGEFAKLEQKGAFAAAPPAAAAPAPAVDVDPRPPREEKQVDGRKYVLTRDNPVGTLLAMSRREKREMVKILQRLRFLMTKVEPGILGGLSWRDRVVKALDKIGATQGAAMANPAKFAAIMGDLLDESNKLFGDWRKEPEPKIVVVGGR